MKPEMITLKVGQATIKVPATVVAQSLLAGVLTQLQPAAPAPAPAPCTAPALGEYWAGQGGHNGGLVAAHGDVPAHYLIFATEDIGQHKWGGYEEESAATSKRDGLANTKSLLYEGGHPAAEAAAKHSADGHTDFYLPAAAELYQGWLNTPELFAKDRWYWSSTQRSADYAFYVLFDVGGQLDSGKDFELRVRPVRRLFI